MRLLAISMLLILAEASAQACPRGTVCVASGTRQMRETAVVLETAPRPRTLLEHAIAGAERHAVTGGALARSLQTHVVAKPTGLAMPWVWQVLRRSVYARMPTYERRSMRQENRFSLALSPVVVVSSMDSVPGLGIEGGF